MRSSTMQRLWDERERKDVRHGDGPYDTDGFVAAITVDYGSTVDGDKVVLINTRIDHIECEDGCGICGASVKKQQTVVERFSRQDALRLAVRAADELWKELERFAADAQRRIEAKRASSPTPIPAASQES